MTPQASIQKTSKEFLTAMAKKVTVNRMCLNCTKSHINGKGLFCTLIPDCEIKIDRPRDYSCPEHKYFSEDWKPRH